MATREMLVLMHNVGQLPPVWQPQVEALPTDLPMEAPWIAGLRPGGSGDFSPARAAQAISDLLTQRGIERAYLCAHSLSSLVAVQVAAQDERIAGMILSLPKLAPTGKQARRSRFFLRFLPGNVNKDQIRQVMDAFAEIDLTAALKEVTAPTVLVSAKGDRTSQQEVAEYNKHLQSAVVTDVAPTPANEGIPSALTGVMTEILPMWRPA